MLNYQRVFIGILMGSESERIFMGIEAAKLRIIMGLYNEISLDLMNISWGQMGFNLPNRGLHQPQGE
jgi:hypothetical protein